jgi:hypothetical protein
LTKEQRSQAINIAFDNMMMAQALIDKSRGDREYCLYKALYECSWGLYLALCEDQRKATHTDVTQNGN